MNIYFLGIAGAGVSALASILKSEGHNVYGSDSGVFPPISTYLDTLGIKYFDGFDKAHLGENIDAAIIGTTAKIDLATNPEYQEIKRRGIKTYSFAEFLSEHTKNRDNLIIAGSFGKSSLTALISFILIHSGKSPGYFIGAIAKDLPTTGQWGNDKEFIIEGDEYVISAKDLRSKFEIYKSKDILISSIVHDHINMFPTFKDYARKFDKLIKNHKDGFIFACNKYEVIEKLVKRNKKNKSTIYYGLNHGDFHAENINIGEISSFDLITPNGKIPLKTTQLGYHNIENIIAAASYVLTKNLVSVTELQDAVLAFNGVTRRLDKKTKTSKIPVYEGFGSSYEKARSAIDAIKLHFASRKIVIVFEPHTFSWRNKDALNWYDTVFEGMSEVIILPPPSHGAGSHSQLSHDEIIERVKTTGIKTIKAETAEFVLDYSKKLEENSVILLLSSGPLFGLPKSLAETLG